MPVTSVRILDICLYEHSVLTVRSSMSIGFWPFVHRILCHRSFLVVVAVHHCTTIIGNAVVSLVVLSTSTDITTTTTTTTANVLSFSRHARQ